MDNSFSIKKSYGGTTIDKDDTSLSITRSATGDVYINASSDIELPVVRTWSSRRGVEETRVYNTFAKLMITIFGKYVLDDYNEEYNGLPEDFVDLENKTITWHSDGGGDSTIKLSAQKDVITISIVKDRDINNGDSSRIVRVRMDGSEYKNYNDFFVALYNDLLYLAEELERTNQDIASLK